eukprot:Seg1942.3 transcript_id=Seg1942.3/GoldUCD/mRNA.D3Y31 product="GATOR complex protein NPRL2" protein_id=Seg1942.3/GoldUCD/D3Y31
MEDRSTEIQCIMFCEFDPVAGPRIAYQSPEDFIGKAQFDSIAPYVITKPQLQQTLITLNAFDYKFLGCSVGIANAKYTRNALLFNVCFVLDEEICTARYEGVVKKLTAYITTLEQESGFISQEETKNKIPSMLNEILHGLNQKGECNIKIDGSNTIFLQLVKGQGNPPVVLDHHVPVFLWDKREVSATHWDLTAQQILLFINGCNHVQKIAAEADMDLNLVRSAVQTLLYYGVITLIPVFLYSNMYALTPEINKLFNDKDMQKDCIKWVADDAMSLPRFRNVFMLYCAMGPGITIKDLCARHDMTELSVNPRLLVQYGLIKNFIHKLNKYPVLVSEPASQKLKNISKCLNGSYNCDEIVCKVYASGESIKYQELDKVTDNDPAVVNIWK